MRTDGPAGTSEAADALNGLAGVLTTEDLAELNRLVSEERQQPEQAARAYLVEQGLLSE